MLPTSCHCYKIWLNYTQYLIRTSQIENVELAVLAKEIAMIKRQISGLDHELDLLNRKTDLKKRACVVVSELSQSNENTLKIQENELAGIIKAVKEYNTTKESLNKEELRDETRIAEMHSDYDEKRKFLQSLQENNRQLESSVKNAEEIAAHQQDLCEIEREEHTKQSKRLLGLRDNLHGAKHDYEILLQQISKLKDDITRTERQVFTDRRTLHHVDADSRSMQSEIRRLSDQGSKLDAKRSKDKDTSAKLCGKIDEKNKLREKLRTECKRTTSEKDVISAQLLMAQIEREKVNQNMKPQQNALARGEDQYRWLKGELEAANARTKLLREEKERVSALLKSQREQQDIIAALEQDLARQIGKNQTLAVELGRPINLHRWRYLQQSDEHKWQLIEWVHKLQKQVISSTDKGKRCQQQILFNMNAYNSSLSCSFHPCLSVTSQSSVLETKKKLLSKLQKETSNQENAEQIRDQLTSIKSELHTLSKEIKAKDVVLRERVDVAETLKCELADLDRKRMELKADYIVSVISGR